MNNFVVKFEKLSVKLQLINARRRQNKMLHSVVSPSNG